MKGRGLGLGRKPPQERTALLMSVRLILTQWDPAPQSTLLDEQEGWGRLTSGAIVGRDRHR